MPCIVRAVKLFITIFLSCSCRHLILQKFCSVRAALSLNRRPPHHLSRGGRCVPHWSSRWELSPVQS